MSILDNISKDIVLIIAIVIVMFLILNYSNVGQKKVSETEPVTENFMSEDIFAHASASASEIGTAPELVQERVIKMQPADTEDNLGDFYDDNLKGSGDYEIMGDNSKTPSNNYNDNYDLGVNLADPQFKALGAVPDTNKMISDDLLPKKKEEWFETPNVGTNVEDANLLADALFRGGVNTLSNVNKNPSLDIRGDIPVPKINVGAFNQSSYMPGSKTNGLCL